MTEDLLDLIERPSAVHQKRRILVPEVVDSQMGYQRSEIQPRERIGNGNDPCITPATGRHAGYQDDAGTRALRRFLQIGRTLHACCLETDRFAYRMGHLARQAAR
jgi:hypothetical protein